MKNLLLASSIALAASAGVAAANPVRLSGEGRIGVTYNDSVVSHNRFAFNTRARVTFTLSGQSDTGIAFGGSFRADNAGGANDGTAGSVFIRGDFGTLTAGDTAGAAQFVTGHVAGVGLTALGDHNETLFLGNNTVITGASRPTFRYNITVDDFTFALSHTNPGANNTVAAIGARYSFEGFTIGAGYENLDRHSLSSIQHMVVSAGFSMDGISVQGNYGRLSSSGLFVNGGPVGVISRTQYSVSASGTFDDVTVSAFYARNFAEADSFGVGASFDLGGGASLRGGVVRTEAASGDTRFTETGTRRVLADFGIAMRF